MNLFGIGHHLLQVLEHEFVDPFAEKEIHDKNNPQYQGENTQEFEKFFSADGIGLIVYNDKSHGPYEKEVHEHQRQELFQEIKAKPVPPGDKGVIAAADLIKKEPYVKKQNDRGNDLPDDFNAGPEPEHGDADTPEDNE
jgi:hypothetical protein